MDAHPPFRSLVEHKAYLRSWLPTVCSHVDFRHDVFLLGDTLRDSWLFFGICACGSKGSRVSKIALFFTMSSSNRWKRASAAKAQASSSSRRREDFPDSQYDDEERHRSPPGDMLRERSRKSLLKTREHRSHYHQKIIWCSVQDIDMRQHGFKLRRDWGRNAEEICTSSWD